MARKTKTDQLIVELEHKAAIIDAQIAVLRQAANAPVKPRTRKAVTTATTSTDRL